MVTLTQNADDVCRFARVSHEIAETLFSSEVIVRLRTSDHLRGTIMGASIGNNAVEGGNPWSCSWFGSLKLQTDFGPHEIDYLTIEAVTPVGVP
jgi:hypothetical protein